MKIYKTEAATQREIKIMDVLNIESTLVACKVVEKEDRVVNVLGGSTKYSA